MTEEEQLTKLKIDATGTTDPTALISLFLCLCVFNVMEMSVEPHNNLGVYEFNRKKL
jgi:hypothetical protein